jgi:hypothetical protein
VMSLFLKNRKIDEVYLFRAHTSSQGGPVPRYIKNFG